MENINSKTMYRDYNISEWKEKCIVLSDEEREEVINAITNGDNSELLETVRLPFPKFVEKYYSKYEGAKKALSDPTFGYRFYLLKDNQMAYMDERFKHPLRKCKDMQYRTTYKINKAILKEMLVTPYEDLIKIRTSENNNLELEKKYIYIGQYITDIEAERMGLKGFTFYSQGKYRGFDLEGKLDSLNPAVRLIMCKYLGLYGEDRMSIYDISKELKLSIDKVGKLFGNNGYVFNYLVKSTKELQNKLCYIDKDYQLGEFIEYSGSDYVSNYKTLDMMLEVQYIIKNLLSPSEREVVDGLSNPLQQKYIFEKKIKPKYHTGDKVKVLQNNLG